MRHQRAGKKLGRDAAHRKALYANLAGALIEHGRIKTTVTKAKAVKPLAEQMITLGRRGDLHARRQAVAFLRSKDVVHHLFAEVAPRFRDRPGGYTRIVKIGPRPGDAAEMAYLELVGEEVEVTPRRRRERAAAEPVPATATEEPPASVAEVVEEPAVEDEAVPAAEEPDAEAEDVAADEPPADEPEAAAETPAEDEAEPTGEGQAAEPEQQA
jgi:large subunit ribosomal protein L17